MVLGVTGNIGAGKSYVCEVFEHLGIPVYNSDARSKFLLETDPGIRESVMTLLGEKAYTENVPDRAYIASVVFSDKEKLTGLNQIMHPAVGKDFDNWYAVYQERPYCIKEAAILIESGAYKSVDKLLVVTADKPVRIDRVMARDSVRKQDVIDRIENQMSQEEKLKFADYHIENNPNVMLLPQILFVHEDLTS